MFSFPIRVYYEDTDASGVVYHAAYLRYFERARTEWLRALGFSQQSLAVELGIAFTVSEMTVRFRAPARLDDTLLATARAEQIKRASLHFEQSLLHRDAEGILASASVRVACVDAASFRPRGLPADLLERLRHHDASQA